VIVFHQSGEFLSRKIPNPGAGPKIVGLVLARLLGVFSFHVLVGVELKDRGVFT
jgi:hypothetical protein